MTKTTAALLLTALWFSFTPAQAQGSLDDAIADYQRGAYQGAVPGLLDHAQRGNPLAQVYLGLAYYNGHGVAEDDSTAFTWFWRAARQGYAEGQFQLGYMYTYGYGIPEGEPDPEGKAVEWLARAAEQRHADAQFNLGLMYIAGSGVATDEDKGLSLIRQAAQNGSPGARRFMAE